MKRYVQREFRFDASESENLCMDGSSLSGNREISEVPQSNLLEGRWAKANSRTAHMYAFEKSDDLVAPSKRANKAGTPVAESVEERGSAKGNVIQVTSSRTQSRNRWGVLGSHTASRLLRRLTVQPKAGAVCGSSARTDLCRGWPERAIPTATTKYRYSVPDTFVFCLRIDLIGIGLAAVNRLHVKRVP